jgi:hypothetical protein
MRSVCRSERPSIVREVTKKVRGPFLDAVTVCVARRSCHGAGFYNINDGMSKLFMRASRCCARACGARKGRYFASYGTAKAVP